MAEAFCNFAWRMSADHLRLIASLQSVILHGGQNVEAQPRGFSKSTICEGAVLWAALYGHQQMVPLISTTKDGALKSMRSIKTELECNPLLAADFPGVCRPVEALEGVAQRASAQTYETPGGEIQHTYIEWKTEEIVLPTIEGYPSSGVVVCVYGIDSRKARGLRYKRRDGRQIRPGMVLIDDPQDRLIAASPVRVQALWDNVHRSILPSGGHAKRLAAVVVCTVIEKDDFADRLLKSKDWVGRRVPMLKSLATNEDLWMVEYAKIKREFADGDDEDKRRAERDATEFYRANRARMDEGAVATWEDCFLPDELSAIQHAYNMRLNLGDRMFWSECQNDPPDVVDRGDLVTAEAIAAKTNGLARGVVPLASQHLTAFIDIQKDILFYTVAAFGDDFTGSVIDYGMFPEQGAPIFSIREVRKTLAIETKAGGMEGAIYAGLERLTANILGREYQREDGNAMRVERCMIDANWGESTDVVFQFCRQSPFSSVLLPSHGRYVGAKSAPFGEYRKKPGDRIGLGWRLPGRRSGARSIRYALFDTNFWKSFMYRRLSVSMGDSGCLSLFGRRHDDHRIFAAHLTAEFRVITEGRGRTVEEWQLRPEKPDNHWLDCTVGCLVAASICGCGLQGDGPGGAGVKLGPGIVGGGKYRVASAATLAALRGGR